MQVSVDTLPLQTAKPVETISLDVTGMKCAGCVSVVERQLKSNPGVICAQVNLVTEVAVVEFQTGKVDPAALAEQLTSKGFPSQPRCSQAEDKSHSENNLKLAAKRDRESRDQIWRLVIASVLVLLSTIGHISHWLGIPMLTLLSNIWLHWGLATLALLGPGRQILVDGWRSWWHGAPNMNTLVGLGTFTAYITSCIALFFPQLGWDCFFDEPVMMLGFILLGRTLEQRARRRARASLESLLALQPQVAHLIGKSNPMVPEHTGIKIPVEQVRIGEWLRILPGEKVPVDGELVVGESTVDESMLTGEATPVLKQPGESVWAGTLNQSGVIAIKATRTVSETRLAQIVKLVEEAQAHKAPVQRLADTVAGYFAYGVITISALTFLFWYDFGTKIWPDVLIPITGVADEAMVMPHYPLLLSLKLAISVLVIACPCALGLATPTAILVGTSLGAEQGLLIKGGDILERVQQLDTVVFDKTGTLTTGEPTITDCLPIGELELFGLPEDEGKSVVEDNPAFPASKLLQLAAAVESGTSHPLAVAICHAASQQGLPMLRAQDFYTEPGLGISALVENRLVLLGNQAWLKKQGVTISEIANTQAQVLAAKGKTVVYLVADGLLVGMIAAEDVPRADAKETVQRLQELGLRVMLLSGDQPQAAAATAEKLSIAPQDVIAGVLPQGKAEAISQLQTQGRRVAMVGDGINDGPALAQADVGISLHAGTDIALETAGIILMRDCLLDVVKSIELSKSTFSKIRQNLFWAFSYNTLGIPAAAGLLLPGFGIILNPSAAGALMALSSVSVVTNSLLLRRTLKA
ncbi:MAG: heavy metal translocating P-type ATPase [Symploca sp. SIO2B6]|nr:heavy metal translocating P-type ATPase [Symploca sp. SIO2B6]